jgi:beta-lactamase class A
MARKKPFDPIVHKRSQIILSVILLVILIVVGVFLWRVTHKDMSVYIQTTPIIGQQLQQATTPEVEIEDRLGFDAEAIAALLVEWEQSVSGTAGVVISDGFDGAVLAATNPDEPFFAASIYKLYVAYEGYRQIDAGTVNPDETYLNGYTREECLDKMIRESDSPCAEKLWVELGKQETTTQLRSYGIDSTSMVAVTTTASDAATILTRIAQGEGLSEQSQQKFLQSMKDQIFRDTLNKSFVLEDAIIYNKIGFNEQFEYHDVAIIEFPDTDRRLVISVMTKNVGTANIVRLGDLLRKSILGQ